ncbi:AAA domain protein [Synechococcus sp. PROS-7-1]|uniref:AAA family ATPase n=1 Tax=Synechococcus sp. PROS-7-1 TaxID=1442556 RepID=UPI001644B425|nr:AAA family ATPase [Synechococcus sp. PROS-7-1]QNI85399.1 AAA domain protein [Synechococcus sp. PROS-7-1]
MRLIRCRLESVRRHRELEVAFAPGLTLIGGGNETGKSSLVEAMHRTLFVRATATGAAVRDLRSAMHAGHPQIELDFEADGHHWSLQKSFSGAGGTCRLSRMGNPALLGAEAEDRLASLLGVEEIIGSRQVNRILPSRWAHLWVMQGLAGRNLLELDGSHYDLNGLIAALENQASESLQSPLDQHIHDQLEVLVSSSFTSRGVKQQSELWKRRQELQQAEQRHQDACQQLEIYESACEELDRNEQALRDLESGTVPELRQQRRRLTSLVDLQRSLVPLIQEEQQLKQQLNNLKTLDAETESTGRSIQVHRHDLERAVVQATQQSEQLKTRQASLNTLEEQRHALEERGHALRRQQELRTLETRIRDHQQRDDLRAHLQSQQASLQNKLDAAPAKTKEALSALQRLQERLRELEIRLNSMASSIHLEAADQEVVLDGDALLQGQTLQRSGAFRLQVGAGVMVQVIPGEGTGLASLTTERSHLQAEFDEGLRQWGASSLDEAREQLLQQQQLTQELALLKARLQQLDQQRPAQVDGNESLETLRQKLSALQLDLESEVVITVDSTALDQELLDCRATYKSVQEQTRALRAGLDALERNLSAVQSERQELRVTVERLEAQQLQRRQQRQAFVETHGESAQIQRRLDALKETSRVQQAKLLALTAEAGLERMADAERQLASLEQQEHNLSRRREDLNREQGGLLERCDRLGRSDLHALVEETSAAMDLAIRAEQQETLVAEARQLLLRRFQEARRDLSRRYSMPLRQSINRFMAPLLLEASDDCELNVDPTEGLNALRLQRSGRSFDFAQLSGGMKEQFNAALRLAIADTLRSSHDGCLPLVFDDAFTNTDPKRLVSVLAMLRQAVDLGLQVVVLSCDPDPYREIADACVTLPAL